MRIRRKTFLDLVNSKSDHHNPPICFCALISVFVRARGKKRDLKMKNIRDDG